MEDLANRLFNILDYYEARDTDTTPETVRNDLQEHPLDIINYLVTEIENIL